MVVVIAHKNTYTHTTSTGTHTHTAKIHTNTNIPTHAQETDSHTHSHTLQICTPQKYTNIHILSKHRLTHKHTYTFPNMHLENSDTLNRMQTQKHRIQTDNQQTKAHTNTYTHKLMLCKDTHMQAPTEKTDIHTLSKCRHTQVTCTLNRHKHTHIIQKPREAQLHTNSHPTHRHSILPAQHMDTHIHSHTHYRTALLARVSH